MNVKTLGLLAGLALCGSAFAQEAQQDPNQMQQGHKEKGQKELNGTVIGVKKDDILVRADDNGAIVPLKVNHQTQLDGKMLKKGESIESHLKKEFSPGAEVRASFDLNKMENQAVTIDRKK
ncbi:MAG: hypothetical protein ACXU86_09420 [Archangium sp.]